MNRTFLIFGVVVALLLMFLSWRYPYVLGRSGVVASIAYSVMLMLFIGPSAFGRYRGRFGLMMEHALLWVGIVLVLMGGYAYRHELAQTRIFAGLFPQQATLRGDGTVEFLAAEDGHFYIEAEINGTPVEFMADTGASDIVLSPADAARVGIDPASLGFTRVYATANGYGKGAPVMLPVFRVGPIELRDIEASVNDAEMTHSLLGMQFFRRLQGFSVKNDRMVLQP